MPIKEGNKLITVSLGGEYITALNNLKQTLKTKNNTKAIKYLLNLFIIRNKE